jgi:hypothetical protein
MLIVSLRWMLGQALLLTVLTSLPPLLTRTLAGDLPPLLYTVEDDLYRLRVGCQSAFDRCAFDSHLLLEGLEDGQAVAQSSPDGTLIAAHFDDGWRLYPAECLLDAAREAPCRWEMLDETPHGSPGLRLAWSDDSALVAYLTFSGTQIKLRTRGCWEDGGTCTEWRLPTPPGVIGYQLDWRGDTLLMTGQPGGLYRFDVGCFADAARCTSALPTIGQPNRLYFAPNLSADASQAVVDVQSGAFFRQVAVIDLASGAVRWLTPPTTDSILPHWSRDGRYLAYSVLDETFDPPNLNLYLYDMMRGFGGRATTTPDNELYPSWGSFSQF